MNTDMLIAAMLIQIQDMNRQLQALKNRTPGNWGDGSAYGTGAYGSLTIGNISDPVAPYQECITAMLPYLTKKQIALMLTDPSLMVRTQAAKEVLRRKKDEIDEEV